MSSPDDLLEDIAELEAENAKLKAFVAACKRKILHDRSCLFCFDFRESETHLCSCPFSVVETGSEAR